MGGFSSMIMCCMSYLSAVTLTGQRTTRVSLLESMSFVGGFLGPFVGAAVFEGAGRTWNFTALVIVNAAIVLYVVAFVPEVPPPRAPPSGGTACQKLTRVSEPESGREPVQQMWRLGRSVVCVFVPMARLYHVFVSWSIK